MQLGILELGRETSGTVKVVIIELDTTGYLKMWSDASFMMSLTCLAATTQK